MLTPYGPLEECRVLMDRQTGQSRGCAIARFTNEEDMQKAIQEVNETELDGRTITIRAFTPNAPQNKDRRGNGKFNKSFEGRQNERKTTSFEGKKTTFDEEEMKEEEQEEMKEEEQGDVKEETEENPEKKDKKEKDKKDKKDKKEKQE